MKAVFALAFLALARAAIIEKPSVWKDDAMWWKNMNPMWMRSEKPLFFDDAMTNIDYTKVRDVNPMWIRSEKPIFFDDAMTNMDFAKVKEVNPLWTRSMFEKFGFEKPVYNMDFVNFGKNIGVEDMHMLNHLRSFYDTPSLVFFQDPSGKIVSYYAHEGIDKVNYIPEIKSAFSNLYGSSDALSVNFKPNEMLGQYKTILPGHFFEPVKDAELIRYMHDVPMTHYHVNFKPQLRTLFDTIDIDSLPSIYKKPVTLDVERFLSDAIPATHSFAGYPMVNAFSAAPAFPFAKTNMISGATPYASGMSSYFVPSGTDFYKSGLGLTSPAIKSAAYHLVKADYPFFTAAPGFETAVASPATGIPLMKASTASPMFTYAEPGVAYAPTHGYAAAPAPAGLIHAGHAASPIFAASPSAAGANLALFKSGACEGCLVSEHGVTFVPAHAAASGFPLFKSAAPATGFFGEPALSHLSAASATPYFRAAAPAHTLFSEPALGHFGASAFPAYKAAFPATFGADSSLTFNSAGVPLVKTAAPITTSLFAEPAISTYPVASSPLTNWKKF